MSANQSYGERIRWIAWVNGSGEECPAFGLVRPTGIDGLQIQGAKPNADGGAVFVNSKLAVPAGGVGLLTNDFPVRALYDTGDGTPAFGETWGAGNGSWKLRKNKAGFTVYGGGASGRVMVTRPLLDSSGDDVLVKVSSSDTTADYLNVKILPDTAAISGAGAKTYGGITIREVTSGFSGAQHLAVSSATTYISSLEGPGDSAITITGWKLYVDQLSGIRIGSHDTGGPFAFWPEISLIPAAASHPGGIDLTDGQELGDGGKIINGYMQARGNVLAEGRIALSQAVGVPGTGADLSSPPQDGAAFSIVALGASGFEYPYSYIEGGIITTYSKPDNTVGYGSLDMGPMTISDVDEVIRGAGQLQVRCMWTVGDDPDTADFLFGMAVLLYDYVSLPASNFLAGPRPPGSMGWAYESAATLEDEVLTRESTFWLGDGQNTSNIAYGICFGATPTKHRGASPTTTTTYFSVTVAGGIVISGTTSLASGDIPNLPASKITSGTFDAARIPDLSATYSVTTHDHDADYAPLSHAHSGTDITSGTVAAARLPALSSLSGAITSSQLPATPVADGTYTIGARLTGGGTDGTITITNGVITAITQAT